MGAPHRERVRVLARITSRVSRPTAVEYGKCDFTHLGARPRSRARGHAPKWACTPRDEQTARLHEPTPLPRPAKPGMVRARSFGEVSEWSKVPDSKSGVAQVTEGSNPSLSASWAYFALERRNLRPAHLERCPSGLRCMTGNHVWGNPPWVRIPPSPPPRVLQSRLPARSRPLCLGRRRLRQLRQDRKVATVTATRVPGALSCGVCVDRETRRDEPRWSA